MPVNDMPHLVDGGFHLVFERIVITAKVDRVGWGIGSRAASGYLVESQLAVTPNAQSGLCYLWIIPRLPESCFHPLYSCVNDLVIVDTPIRTCEHDTVIGKIPFVPFLGALSRFLALVSRGVGVLERVVEHVGVAVEGLGVARLRHHRIRADEAAQQRIIEPRAVVIEAQGGIPGLSYALCQLRSMLPLF